MEETIGESRIILGNCLDVLPTLGRVDHVISDPPYEKEAHRADRRVMRKDGLVAGALSFDAITTDTRQAVAAWAAANCDGWFIAFCQAEGVAPWRDCIERGGAKYKVPMVWIKPDGMLQFNGQGPGMGFESMVSAWCGKGHSKWNGGGRHGVFTVPKGGGGQPAEHETQKPIRLMSQLVELFTNRGQLVVDPFCGSGSTGVACVRLGRRFIGIELEERHWETTCRRIERAYSEPDMFIERPAAPKQEAML